MRGFCVTLLGVCLALLGACSEQEPVAIRTPVKVVEVQGLDSTEADAYAAVIQPESTVQLAFRVSGYIDTLANRPLGDGGSRSVQAGDTVTKGEVLAQVERQEYEDKVQVAQANLDKAQAAAVKASQDYKRASALRKNDSITGPDYDAARSEHDSALAAVAAAQAKLDEANIQLDDTRLQAPMAATVLDRQVTQGDLVHNGTVGFVLADIETVKAVFAVPGATRANISSGSTLTLDSPSVPERKFEGVVTEIAAAGDDRTHLFNISVQVGNSEGLLSPGMTAGVSLPGPSGAGPVVGIPLQAITRGKDGAFAVYVIEDAGNETIARQRPITPGRVRNDEVAVLSGLAPGDSVIITGVGQVRDGQPVNVRQ